MGLVNISRLDKKAKRELWEHLNANHPDKAKEIEAFMKDETVKALISHFDGGYMLEKEYIPDELMPTHQKLRTRVPGIS